MLKKLIFGLFFTGIFLLPDYVVALHIVGGDVTYTCLGKSANGRFADFRITFTMYRDSRSGGAPFDVNARFGVYQGSGTNWRYVETISNINPRSIAAIPIEAPNPCLIVPTNLGVDKGVYEFDVRLEISASESYLIAYQRCCRNNTISNLVNPGTTGAAFTIELTPFAQQTCNNSPVFNDFPPVVICVNESISFDHSAKDKDGDQITYEFCAPLTAGGTDGSTGVGSADACTGVTPNPFNCRPPFNQVTFALPFYSFSKPMAGNPTVFIDANTGLIDGKPNLTGQYVVGVCVKEFRNGQLLSIIQRDFQFNVTNCQSAVNAKIDTDQLKGDTSVINLCGDSLVNITNLSTEASRILSYYWEFDVSGQKRTFNTRDLKAIFPGVGTYDGKMVLNRDIPNAENCKDSVRVRINVFPPIRADFTYDYDTCVAGPVFFTDKSVAEAGSVVGWSWKFENEKDVVKNPAFEFETPGKKLVQLEVTDKNNCKALINKEITYFPVPALIIIEPDNFIGCVPGDIFFNNLSKPIDNTYNITWNLGDGNISKEISPKHRYTQTGNFTVTVDIISPIGCKVSQTFPDWITILEKPDAGFTYQPELPTIFNNTVTFTDASRNAVSWFWKFGNSGTSYIKDPVFTFRDTGIYEIVQVVMHQSGCTDTAVVVFDIEPIVDIIMPNAFTPNGDGLNDTFYGRGVFDGIKNYRFTVWNRWGENIFETDNPQESWNGRLNNQGEVLQAGIYIYQLEYTTPRNQFRKQKGQCTLIK